MECANCDNSWNEIITAKASKFIRTQKDLDKFDFSSILTELSPADLNEFKSTFKFRREDVFDETGKLIVTKQGVSTFSVEILVKKYKFDPDKIEKVAAVFGIGPERFWRRYHYFGDLYPTPHCVPRPYYNCPW